MIGGASLRHNTPVQKTSDGVFFFLLVLVLPLAVAADPSVARDPFFGATRNGFCPF